MKSLIIVLFVSSLFCLISGAGTAEIFKYVDTEGNIHFTDTPPVGVDAKPMDIQPNIYEGSVQSKSAGSDEPSASEIRKKNLLESNKPPKVELFVTSWCGYCKKAKSYLNKKGISYIAYDIEKDLQAARRKDSLTSRKGVPFALIGDQKITGFSEAAYDRALQEAL